MSLLLPIAHAIAQSMLVKVLYGEDSGETGGPDP